MLRFRTTWASNAGMVNTNQLRPENEVRYHDEKARSFNTGVGLQFYARES